MAQKETFSDSKPIIELIDISKTYFQKSSMNHLVLDKISFSINAREFIVIMGSSGSGKTTLLNLIIGLLVPTLGKINIFRKDISLMNENQLALLRQSKFGFVFQQFNLFDELTAIENIELPLLINNNISPKERKLRAEKLLDKFNLLHKKSSFPDELSGGEKQKIGIARALISDPEIILVDEPTGNLDSSSASEIMDLFHLLNYEMKKTIIMVTHDYNLVKPGMRYIQLEKGKVLRNILVTPEIQKRFYLEHELLLNT